ncbi:MAG: cohesin domain-containing protein [Patescibacteria group bacterium]
MFKKKLLIIVVVASLLLVNFPASASTSFGLYPLKISVKEGQTFRLAVNVNPNNLKNYTVKASVKFPADLVSVSSWQFAGSWQPLSQPGYDSIDNSAGILIKTAGYPGGLSKSATLGTITFKAKKTGTGYISFTGGSMALDEGNTNQYNGGNQVSLVVEKITETPVVAKPDKPKTPETPSASITPSTETPTSTNSTELATSTELNPPLGEQPELITISTTTPEIISPEEFKKINSNLTSLNLNLSAIVQVLLAIAVLLLILIILVLIVIIFYFIRRKGHRTRFIISDGDYPPTEKNTKNVNIAKEKVSKVKSSKEIKTINIKTKTSNKKVNKNIKK